MKRVLFDSDVLLDVLGKREPHFQASVQALNTVKTGKTQASRGDKATKRLAG